MVPVRKASNPFTDFVKYGHGGERVVKQEEGVRTGLHSRREGGVFPIGALQTQAGPRRSGRGGRGAEPGSGGHGTRIWICLQQENKTVLLTAGAI